MIGAPWRRRAALALAVLTAVLLAAAAVSGYARFELLDADEFSARVVSSLDDGEVRRELAEHAVDGIASGVTPDVLTVRPLVTHAVATLADTAPFRRVLARALADQHRALFYDDARAQIDLEYAGTLLHESLGSVSPRIARVIPRGTEPQLVSLDEDDARLVAARKLRNLADWWWPLLACALAAAAACGVLAGGVRAAVAHLGAALAAAGLTVAALVTLAGTAVVGWIAGPDDEQGRAAVRAIWEALFADLRTAGLIAAVGGLVVAAVAASRPTFTVARLAETARSASRGARIARGLALVAAGAIAIVEPGLIARALVVVVGLGLVLLGIGELRGRGQGAAPRAMRPADEDSPGQGASGANAAWVGAEASGAEAEADAGRGAEPVPVRPLLLAGVLVGVVAAVVVAAALVLPAPRVPAPAAAVVGQQGGCNGSRALCGRRLDEVAFASTHNSYAASDEPGWLFPNQRHGIERQLRDGIRGFLIDVHWGRPDPSRKVVRTDLAAEGADRNKVKQEVGAQGIRKAELLAGRLGVDMPPGKPRPYLCHTLCELGAEPLDEQFQLFADFLEANPREVVVLFVEPYVPVEPIEEALQRTGLLDQAAELKRDEPLPTLGELVAADTRLVILTEQEGGARSWYLDGFSFVQDTPLGATNAKELRCDRFRGTPDSPLLLLNHWIDTFPPPPSRNERIGNRVLRERLRRCARERDLTPNLITVDFYERTGVVGIAQRRNARPRATGP